MCIPCACSVLVYAIFVHTTFCKAFQVIDLFKYVYAILRRSSLVYCFGAYIMSSDVLSIRVDDVLLAAIEAQRKAGEPLRTCARRLLAEYLGIGGNSGSNSLDGITRQIEQFRGFIHEASIKQNKVIDAMENLESRLQALEGSTMPSNLPDVINAIKMLLGKIEALEARIDGTSEESIESELHYSSTVP